MIDITNPDSIRDTVFAIARDGARSHIKAGIVKRLRELRNGIEQSFDARRDGWLVCLDAAIESLEQMQ